MSRTTKYRLSLIVTAACAPVMCYALSRMVPAGLGGDTPTVKRWSIVCFVAAVVGCISFITMQYYKGLLEDPEGATTEMDILAAASAEMEQQKQAARAAQVSQPPQPSAPQQDRPNR